MKPLLNSSPNWKRIHIKENYRQIPWMNIDTEILIKYWQTESNSVSKYHYHNQVSFISGMQGWFNLWKSLNVIQHIKEAKTKPHDRLNRCRKSLWQNSTPFLDKSCDETRNRKNVSQHNKDYKWQAYSQTCS
jgi:hypothetical protein